ncbi:MotA/TolQ/ExbB proton channel family protein [Marivirga sp.]|uniref:MotA/TolQ/ExbB proton channel family protein n=1 Tax=Marivirga sp. TaxID=2018662 RepID=UPI002D7FD6FC|nr:MotA/TolQ/ExbB proton channel family protein [Marivirga sp.]HET8860886.1 MotA/TolQ/ExbB proton channel family protein [Marivirga sp.]
MKNSSSILDSIKSKFVAIIIPLEILIAVLIYMYILENPANFQGGDPSNHPLPDNYLGIIYKGGFIVPILISLLLLVITFGIERLLIISKAKGKGDVRKFVAKVKSLLAKEQITDAIQACNEQKGSVANVVKSGLIKFQEEAKSIHSTESEKQIVAIQKEIEETTLLEMPMLEKNLVIISTIASIATLMGLLGTVMGMIKAFAAIATAGAPDAVALANGISEALINTALGIGTSALAIIAYNYFTNKIDALTHSIDEASYSIIQHFSAFKKTRKSTFKEVA